MIPKSLKLKDDTSAFYSFCFFVGGMLGSSIFAISSVIAAAISGWLIAWFFPVTFAAFMTLIHLGGYELWQLTAVVSFVSLMLKMLRG